MNIVINNVIKNKEKFGVYKAIGINNKNIIRIQLMETFYYSICATFFSLIIGNALGYFLFILQKNNIYFYDSLRYEIYPIVLMLVAIILSEILIYIFSKYYLRNSISNILRNNK